MSLAQVHAPRSRLCFSVDGLSLRDELMLKSLVRLLDYLTQQQWIYRAEAPDLAIRGNGAPGSAPAPLQESAAVLFVGEAPPEAAFSIGMPLHPIDLERELNRVGTWIDQRRVELAASIKVRGEAANA